MSGDDVIQDLADSGLLDEPGASAVVISPGKACTCGPGFCAAGEGVCFMGVCRGARAGEPGPDCPLCSAPHQLAGARCWLCGDGVSLLHNDFSLRCLAEGVRVHEVFEVQDAATARGEQVSVDVCLDVVLARRRGASS